MLQNLKLRLFAGKGKNVRISPPGLANMSWLKAKLQKVAKYCFSCRGGGYSRLGKSAGFVYFMQTESEHT